MSDDEVDLAPLLHNIELPGNTKMSGIIGGIGEYDQNSETWSSYIERFELLIECNNIKEEKKVSTLLIVAGVKTYSLLRDLCTPNKPSTKSFDALVSLIQDHLYPKPSFIAERYKFSKRIQHEGESAADYIAQLRKMSTHCEFGAVLNDYLRDRLVSGIRNEATKQKLLGESSLTFDQAVKIITSAEAAEKNAAALAINGSRNAERLQKMTAHHRSVTAESRASAGAGGATTPGSHHHNPKSSSSHDYKVQCSCYGNVGHLRHQCRLFGVTCNACGKKNHIAKAVKKILIRINNFSDLSNSPNIVGSAGSMETTIDNTKETGGKQNLIIPEKSSSFSIHPERLCTDVCSYCFGKFGSLDTPCHLAQLKNSERQSKILAIEVHLSADSCLCDGCFRYVDRKANCPTSQRSRKPAARRGPLAGTVCAVQECSQPARHSVRRKWLIKLKKSIGKKLVIDMDKNPHLPIPLCSQHYYWVDYFTVCGICKKRLTRNHMYALGPEADDLNQALSDDGIPVRLSDKLFLCKLCRYYSSLRLKYRDPTTMSSTHRLFLNSYRKKILHYHDIPVSDSEEEGKSVEDEATTSEVPKAKKKKSKSKSFDGHESKKRSADKEEKSDAGNEERSNDSQMIDYSYLDSLNVHREEPTTPTVDYSSLGDFEGGFSNIASLLNPLEGGQGTVYPSDSQNRSRVEKPTRIQVKFGNLNIGKLSNLNIGQDTRPASTATPALERPPYLPGERDLNLSGEFEFHGTLNPISSWERCTSTIQFDRDTKKLWQELQRPYGNQSSFLRHLVILEKHWRNGSLVLADNPNPRAVKYINSVRNRVQAYDGAKSSGVKEDGKEPELNMASPPPRPMSTPVKVTSDPPPLMKITPGSSWLPNQLKRPPPYKFPVTSTQTTGSASGMLPATVTTPAPPPPPYRFPARPSQSGPRTMRMPCPSHSYIQSGRGQQNVRPVSISYHQFKKIRLEQPPPAVSTSQVTIIPKVEPVSQSQPTSTITSSETEFVPLICDVRSLATSTSTSDWNESFRKQQQKLLKQNVAKYYAPILPKMPSSLTVTTFPKTSGLVMKTSSLTIEKAPNVNTKPNIAPPEKPSISVFRETTPSENG
ncbi:uncharacterized protein LOC124358417 [Homalodisca vitripennis]|uniref:uncharacterized protein LOC124358417 n=1 Tax=Homalodisca vitripennis TaxID=197043 RepID=UPI001EEA70D3|nr:uncharacterized protein LOC124358417 [Homalodisca vitripennis]